MTAAEIRRRAIEECRAALSACAEATSDPSGDMAKCVLVSEMNQLLDEVLVAAPRHATRKRRK